MLPSITGVPLCGPGHVHLSHLSHLARSGSAPTLLLNQQHDVLLASTKLQRTRTEWLDRADEGSRGEVRNIKVMGVVGGRILVAFQGQGRVRVYLENEHSPELKDIGDGEWHSKYEKFMHPRYTHAECRECGRVWRLPAPKGSKCPKCRRRVDFTGSDHRFAEFAVPPLPASILAVGCTEAADDHRGPSCRPTREARCLAYVSVSGQVKRSQTSPCIRGAKRPMSTGSVHHLSACQKRFG